MSSTQRKRVRPAARVGKPAAAAAVAVKAVARVAVKVVARVAVKVAARVAAKWWAMVGKGPGRCQSLAGAAITKAGDASRLFFVCDSSARPVPSSARRGGKPHATESGPFGPFSFVIPMRPPFIALDAAIVDLDGTMVDTLGDFAVR